MPLSGKLIAVYLQHFYGVLIDQGDAYLKRGGQVECEKACSTESWMRISKEVNL